MRITEVETIPVDLPVVEPFEIGFWGYIEELPTNIVKITTDDGTVGYGEAPSYKGFLDYAGESYLTDKIILEEYIREALVGENPLDIERLYEKMNTVTSGNWLIKSAVDMALYDVAGKALNVPAYTLLGGLTRERQPVSRSVFFVSPEEGARDAKKWIHEVGANIVKVKVGRDVETDAELVHAVRDAVGDEIDIRIDANQGYSVKEAIRAYEEMKDANLTFFEQPTDRDDYEGMATITNEIDIPVMADESVDTPDDVKRIANIRAADLLSIGVFKGGMTLPKRMITAADVMGLECYLGATYGTAIGTAASVHLTASLKNVTYGNETIGSLILEEDIVEGDWKDIFGWEDGYIRPPDKPGLGVELDEAMIEKYSADWEV